MAQFSHQHQFDVPPKLQAPSHIRRLASGCLAKSPLLRPAVGDLRKQIQSAKIAAERGRARELADISAEVGEQALVEEQRQLDQEYRVKARKQLASEAIGVIEGIFDE